MICKLCKNDKKWGTLFPESYNICNDCLEDFFKDLHEPQDKLDEFAKAAMQGYIGGRWSDNDKQREIARMSYEQAAAMMAERARIIKEQKNGQ